MDPDQNPQFNGRTEPEEELTYDQLKNELKELRKKLDEKDNEILELERQNNKLKDEASKYQSALGTATNLQLSDNDENNPVTLKKDILNLQDSLEEYITTCKGDVEI